MIPYGKQNITQADIDAVVAVLKSDFLTQGPKIAEFEAAFADYIGAKYAIAVSNGTAALHLAAMAMNVRDGQKIITTPITFAASANCVRYCGGEVVFSDIDAQSYLLDIQLVEKLLSESPKGTYQGIIPVDFAGLSVDMEAFRSLADKYGLWIIEDACHAPGGYFIDSNGISQKCGNCAYADIAIFSFHPVKHIACGEGGMITTNNKKTYDQLLKLRTHGITREDVCFLNDVEWASGQVDADNYPSWYMELQQLGFNYRLTDIQASLGLSQLQRMEYSLSRRKDIANTYYEAFKDKQFIIGQSGMIKNHAYHLYVIETEQRLALYNYLKTFDIRTQVHYIPLHLMPYYRSFGWKEGDCPISEQYYKNCLSLPMYPSLSEQEQNFVIDKVLDFFS